MKKNYLFDLDGTLLPMDLQKFIELYLNAFCKRFSPSLGIEPKALTDGIWAGAKAMTLNDGRCLNRELFWEAMSSVCGRDMLVYEELFDDFYRTDFVAAKDSVWVNPCAAKCIELLKNSGNRLILATNPIFPKSATYTRLRWAGLEPEDFSRITVYDNSKFSKPKAGYYREICEQCGISPENSIMVGNDVDEDMCAADQGFDVFLVTDCLINRDKKDISDIKSGTLEDFYGWIKRNGESY